MTGTEILLASVAAVAVLAAVGAFTIAYRRGAAPEAGRVEPAKPEAPPTEAPPIETPPAEVTAEAPAEVVKVEAPVEEVAAPPAGPPTGVAVQTIAVPRLEEVPEEEAGVTRRQFFNRALLGTFGAFLALFGVNSLAMMWPRLSGGFGSDVDAGELEDLRSKVFQADGSIAPLFIPEARAYVVPVDDGALAGSQFADLGVSVGGLMAIWQRCVHLGCRVPWCATSQGFECPCHGSKYNVVGEYEAGPAPRNLDRFVLEEKAGRLLIKTGSIIETPRASAKSVPYPQGPSCIAITAGE